MTNINRYVIIDYATIWDHVENTYVANCPSPYIADKICELLEEDSDVDRNGSIKKETKIEKTYHKVCKHLLSTIDLLLPADPILEIDEFVDKLFNFVFSGSVTKEEWCGIVKKHLQEKIEYEISRSNSTK